MNNRTISISTYTLVKAALGIFIVWFLYSIRLILAIFFFAILLSAALDSWIDKLVNKRFPRFIAVLIIFGLLLVAITVLVSTIIPPVNSQIREMITQFPLYYESISNSLTFLLPNNDPATSSNVLSPNVTITNIIHAITSLFGGLVAFGLVLVITFYMSLEENATKRTLVFLLPQKYHDYSLSLFNKIQEKVGLWLQGQLTISLIMSVIIYIGLRLLGVEYALVLALIAGLAEFIPYIGPITSGIFAFIIGFSLSPLTGVLVLSLYIIVQQIQSHILIPQIMRKTVGLNPIISIFALLVGVKIGGVLGAILAIPTAAAISVVLEDIHDNHKKSVT